MFYLKEKFFKIGEMKRKAFTKFYFQHRIKEKIKSLKNLLRLTNKIANKIKKFVKRSES